MIQVNILAPFSIWDGFRINVFFLLTVPFHPGLPKFSTWHQKTPPWHMTQANTWLFVILKEDKMLPDFDQPVSYFFASILVNIQSCFDMTLRYTLSILMTPSANSLRTCTTWIYLEDHPRYRNLGSPPFLSQNNRPFGRTPGIGDLLTLAKWDDPPSFPAPQFIFALTPTSRLSHETQSGDYNMCSINPNRRPVANEGLFRDSRS